MPVKAVSYEYPVPLHYPSTLTVTGIGPDEVSFHRMLGSSETLVRGLFDYGVGHMGLVSGHPVKEAFFFFQNELSWTSLGICVCQRPR